MVDISHCYRNTDDCAKFQSGFICLRNELKGNLKAVI